MHPCHDIDAHMQVRCMYREYALYTHVQKEMRPTWHKPGTARPSPPPTPAVLSKKTASCRRLSTPSSSFPRRSVPRGASREKSGATCGGPNAGLRLGIKPPGFLFLFFSLFSFRQAFVLGQAIFLVAEGPPCKSRHRCIVLPVLTPSDCVVFAACDLADLRKVCQPHTTASHHIPPRRPTSTRMGL